MSSEDDERPISEEGQEDEGPVEDEEATLAIVLHRDTERLGEEFDKDEFPGAEDALKKYSILVKDLLIDLCGLQDFAHVEFLEVSTSYQAAGVDSPFCLVVGPPRKDADGELLGVSGPALHTLDLMGALTASNMLPDMFTNKLGLDDEGVLGFVDEEMADQATDLSERVGLEGRYEDLMGDDQDSDLASALASLVPEGSDLSPVHPEDLLSVIPVFLAEATKQAEAAPAISKKEKQRGSGSQGGGLISRIRGLMGAVRGAGVNIVSQAGRRVRGLRGAVWRLEDVVTFAAKHGLRIAAHAVRPILIGVVLHRSLRTLESSRTLGNRLARMPPGKALDYYFRTLLGNDYPKQIEADLAAAIAEVDAGLVTDDYVDEKRLLTATMLRRLEVEEWDKERMKHFYYGSYGLGPWYFDMEERLHNPYFMGARAWNGPIEGWVNKNKVYSQDLPPLDFDAAALSAVQRAEGVDLTPEQQHQIILREKVRPSAGLTREGGILHGIKLSES